MATFTVISESGASEVDAVVDGERVLVSRDALASSLGWELKPQGLCRGDVCVPASGRLEPDGDGRVDLVAAAALLQLPALVDGDARAVVVGVSAEDRRRALQGRRLPDIALPDLDGVVQRVDRWSGKKKLLVAFASW
jgi:hypothetical protein